MHQVVLDHEYFRKGEYTTHFIEDYKILEKVKEYIKAQKAAQPAAKIAAVTAAVGMYMNSILASSEKNK